jgi:hypothetical protein
MKAARDSPRLVLVVAVWNNAVAARWWRVETEPPGASGDVRV